MQEFFVRNYRPTIQRGKIFRQLHSIYMRRNENPRAVVDRMVAAIQYAKTTIELLNRTNTDQNDQMTNITDSDVTELMSRAFCSNNTTNTGHINILMQKKFRSDKPRYDHAANGFTPFYTIANSIVSDLGTMYYARDPLYKIHHYEPLPLPLWEIPHPKQNSPSKTQLPHLPRKRHRFNSRNPSFQPPYKRQRYNKPPQQNAQQHAPYNRRTFQPRRNIPRFNTRQYNPQQNTSRRFTPNSRNIHRNAYKFKCYRCGRDYHLAKQCRAFSDTNGTPLHPNDRRIPASWPFKPHAKTNQYTQSNRSQSWKQYNPSSNPSNIPQKSNTPQSDSTSTSAKLSSMIADLRHTACEDTHIDPSILLAIDEVRNKIKPPNDSQARH